MRRSIDQLRRDATALKKAWRAADPEALRRVETHRPRPEGADLGHADFLHVIAREAGFASWPHLKASVEVAGMDRAARIERLGIALTKGHDAVTLRLLEEDPDLARGDIGLACRLYLAEEVARILAADPAAATRPAPRHPPLTMMAQSRAIHLFPEREAAMLAIADRLLAGGADVDHGAPVAGGGGHRLSTLFFAIGHANNMALAEWLLDHGANPNDNESLYHATELGHRDGLRLLLAKGADPSGTNALLRAIDFHDVEAVRLLLDAGARPDDFGPAGIDGAAPSTMPALHQAARRHSPPEIVALLLDHGADPARRHLGVSTWSAARVFGNRALAEALAARGATTPLTREEALLARAADGLDSPGDYIDPAKLPPAYGDLIRQLVHLPGTLEHMRRLVALGVEYDRPDPHERITPTQIAGWEGKPDILAWFLSLKPDLAHVNAYGGTLLSTILHGSENNPARTGRDHIGCVRLVLEEGVALPRAVIAGAGDPEIADFLRDWAVLRPGQVVADPPA